MDGFLASALAAFFGGALSFLSPCVLPLVPGYLCFAAGLQFSELSELDEKGQAAARILPGALAFVGGFSVVFIALGAGASAINPLLIAYQAELGQIAGVTIIALGLHVAGLIHIPFLAREARLEGSEWVLQDARVWPLAEGVNPQSGVTDHTELRLVSTLTQESIRDRFGRPSTIPLWDLPRFIAELETAGFSARRHIVWFQMELAKPFFLVAMVLLGAGFTMRPTRLGRTGVAVLSAVLLGFVLYYVRNFAQILGENGQIAPLLAAWVTPLASVLLALGLILHIEDG